MMIIVRPMKNTSSDTVKVYFHQRNIAHGASGHAHNWPRKDHTTNKLADSMQDGAAPCYDVESEFRDERLRSLVIDSHGDAFIPNARIPASGLRER